MKILSKLLVYGAVGAGAILVDRTFVRRRARLRAQAPTREVGTGAGIVDAEIIAVGIAEVDPSGLVGMGEAVDPEATKQAHEEVPEQRAKLPVRGRDIP